MRAGVLVGVDVGTTRVKALALTPDGAQLSTSECPTPWRHHGPATDADPEELAAAVAACAAQAATDAAVVLGEPAAVLGLGFTGMAETGVLLDEAGRPCAPALAWHDTRADLAPIAAAAGVQAFRAATGRDLTPLPSLGKLLWLRRNVPGAQLTAGDVQALVAQKPYDIGKQGVEQALAALSGGTVNQNIQTESLIVTKDNMSQPDVSKYIYKAGC